MGDVAPGPAAVKVQVRLSVQFWVFTLLVVLLPREQKLVGWGEEGVGCGGGLQQVSAGSVL